jgi:hypothetical protein
MSEAAKAYFSQPGAVEERAKLITAAMNRSEVRAKCSQRKKEAFAKKLKELGMTREEYDQTPKGKAAAASRRYQARLRLKNGLEAG